MKFARGTIVYHKTMGKGLALNEIEEKGEKLVEVRMLNGHIEKFYPEELETEEVVQARYQREAEQINEANKNSFDPY